MKTSRKTRWPLKADYHHLSRADVSALVNAFGEIRNLEFLRETSNFRHVSFIEPIGFDVIDQYKALGFVVDAVNAAPEDEGMAALRKRLKRYLGALDQPIAVKLLSRYNFVIEPKVWLDKVWKH